MYTWLKIVGGRVGPHGAAARPFAIRSRITIIIVSLFIINNITINISVAIVSLINIITIIIDITIILLLLPRPGPRAAASWPLCDQPHRPCGLY